MDNTLIPWRALMVIAFTRWSLAPQAFWSMTLREFSSVLESTISSAPLETISRDDLSIMLDAYPDQDRIHDHE